MRSGYTRQSLTRQPQRAAESPQQGPGKTLRVRAAAAEAADRRGVAISPAHRVRRSLIRPLLGCVVGVGVGWDGVGRRSGAARCERAPPTTLLCC